ncbi:hypothetical protein CHLRE_10g428706v5 [Chlamydomonas reinhardtii]|uniref:Uncharacterized protein n=1 Tax=Chlamydomonas reinhardtii TaxID=3055 RepID=A0A2K3D9Q1_CHLRE|nr:uncharacterized protein CHLRE_10g428706v5 [Chlamydomonas reinhardtii]PNW77254.1 hypothetical protein CHLRE_10g428706v5 [Chlamydomonas reinhardtii]
MTSQQSQNLEASTPDIARQGLSLETGPSRANASTHPDPSRVWTPVVVRCIASFLPPNEVACSLRLVDSATAAQFAAPAHATVTLSQPVPHHAFAAHWTRPDAFAALSRLDRQVLLRNTARSGCVDNLCLALDLIPDWNVNVDLVLDAATGGSLACAQLAKERGHVVIGHPSLKAAARAGSRELCEWLLRERLAHDRRALPGWAARGGHEALMEHFITATANCCDALGVDDVPNTELLEGAAHGLPLPALQRLYRRQFGGCIGGGAAGPGEREGMEAAAEREGTRRGSCDLAADESAAAAAAAGGGGGGGGGGPGGRGGCRDGRGGEFAWAYGGRGCGGGGRGGSGWGPRVEVCEELQCLAALLAAAAGSPTPDWLDKLTWLEAQLPRGGAEGRRRLGPKVRLAVMRAAAEAPWGAGARLRWLHQSGYEMEEELLIKASRALRGNLDALDYCLEVLGGGGNGGGGGGGRHGNGGGVDCQGGDGDGGGSGRATARVKPGAAIASTTEAGALAGNQRAAAAAAELAATALPAAAAEVAAASAGLKRCSRELVVALERLAAACALDGNVGALEVLRRRGLLLLRPPQGFLKELVESGTLQSLQWVVERWQEQEQAQVQARVQMQEAAEGAEVAKQKGVGRRKEDGQAAEGAMRPRQASAAGEGQHGAATSAVAAVQAGTAGSAGAAGGAGVAVAAAAAQQGSGGGGASAVSSSASSNTGKSSGDGVHTGNGGSHGGSSSPLLQELHSDRVILAACSAQRQHGQPVLAWLRARGCVWSAECFTAAAGAGASEAQLAWMIADGCPVPTGGEPYTLAAYQGNLIGLQAMARLGCPWGPPGRALARAIFFHGRGRPPLTALDEMLRLGCPVDWRRVLAAAQRRECRYNIADEQLMEWILEGEELCRRRQAAHAARGRRVLGWVLRVACCGGRSGPDMGLFEGYDKMEVEEPSESESEDDFW